MQEQKFDELVENRIDNPIEKGEWNTTVEYDEMTEGTNKDPLEKENKIFFRKELDIAGWIKQGRKNKGYTMRQLSDKTNGQVSLSCISLLESCQRKNPGLATLLIIGEILDIKISDLIGQNSSKDNPLKNGIDSVTEKLVLLGNSIDTINGTIPETIVNEMLVVDCLGTLSNFQGLLKTQLNNFVNGLNTEI